MNPTHAQVAGRIAALLAALVLPLLTAHTAAAQPFIAPTTCPVSSGWGIRWGVLHDGTDYGCPIGTPFYAVASGTIEATGPAQGYGFFVQQRTDGGYMVQYGHISDWIVYPGQWVVAGQLLGYTGNAGQATGPHLHLRIHSPWGEKLDPLGLLGAFLPQAGPAAPPPVSDGSGTYTVRPGDTLAGIAARYGTDFRTLAGINGISDPDLIWPGTQLEIG